MKSLTIRRLPIACVSGLEALMSDSSVVVGPNDINWFIKLDNKFVDELCKSQNTNDLRTAIMSQVVN